MYLNVVYEWQVIQVKARQKKTLKGNFIMCMQTALKNHFGTEPVGLGGVFVQTNGKARIHVMV